MDHVRLFNGKTARAAVLALVFAATSVFGPNQALSFTGGGNDKPKPIRKCTKRGFVWSPRIRRCVRKRSHLLNDNERYRYAVWLGKRGHHRESIEILEAVATPGDPKVLTYLGYNHRNLGDFATGLKYYKQALARDPNFVQAREYLGEGYLKTGRMDLAMVELAEIKKRCGTGCEAYRDLSEEIQKARK